MNPTIDPVIPFEQENNSMDNKLITIIIVLSICTCISNLIIIIFCMKSKRISNDTCSNEYDWIEYALKQKECAGNEWEKYLYDFKKHKLTESKLIKLTENEWKELIPEIGVRIGFRELWKKRYNQK